MVQHDGPSGLDAIAVDFDDHRAVASAGIALISTLSQRLGVERLVDADVDLGDRPGAGSVGAKVMTLVSAMALGADCIDDCDLLRSGRTADLVGHRVMAPSTLGTFLRAFTFGHVRQLDRVLGQTIERAWAAGAGPDDGRLVIDVDSFVGEVFGPKKHGAAFGYTRVRGYHPILACRADTGEVLHIRLRKGSANTSRGMSRFCDELVARIGRTNHTGRVLLRADSGFWNGRTFDRLDRARWDFSIGVRLQPQVRAVIEAIDEDAWSTLADYPKTSIAQIAETELAGRRLVVRRVRTLDRQGQLLPTWQHYAFVTNRAEDLALVEAEHRQHAQVELAIRDLKDQALAHFPSGRFHANGAWTVIAALAHNLLRWTQTIGQPGRRMRTARTLRRRMLALPGRLTRSARRWMLHLPARWPWRHAFIEALERIRALPAPA